MKVHLMDVFDMPFAVAFYILPKYDPSANPRTEILCKPIGGIMEEEAMTRSHGGGIIGRGSIEKESLRGASGRHLGAIWEASGKLQEASGGQGLYNASAR